MKNCCFIYVLISISFFSCSCIKRGTSTSFKFSQINKQHSFTDDTIELCVNKNTSVSATSSELNIVQSKKRKYVITSDSPGTHKITLELHKKDGTTLKENILINFYEHGTKDYITVEGLIIDKDPINKANLLLGSPEYIYINQKTGSQSWFYYSKGISIYTNKTSPTISTIRVYPNPEINKNSQYSFSKYPYPIYGINPNTKIIYMDDLTTPLNSPYLKRIFSKKLSLISYDYKNLNNKDDADIGIFFVSDSVLNSKGKKIEMINFY